MNKKIVKREARLDEMSE